MKKDQKIEYIIRDKFKYVFETLPNIYDVGPYQIFFVNFISKRV